MTDFVLVIASRSSRASWLTRSREIRCMFDFSPSMDGIFLGSWRPTVLFLLDEFYGCDHPVSFLDVDDAYALRRPPHGSQVADRRADDHSLLGDQPQLIVVEHVRDAGNLAVLVSDSDVDDTHSAAMDERIPRNRRALAMSAVGHGEDVPAIVSRQHLGFAVHFLRRRFVCGGLGR